MSIALAPLIYVLAFVAVVVLVQTVFSLLFSAQESGRRVNRRLTMLEAGMNASDVYATLVRRPTTPRVGNARLVSLLERMSRFCSQAGFAISPIRLIIIVAATGAVLWLLSLMALRGQPGFAINALVSFIGAFGISAAGAWVLVNSRRNARLKKIEELLPLALDIVNRAIRAGHPVVSAVQLAANEMGDPIGTEFGLIVDETTYGFEFKDALINFARRTGSPDAHFFAVSVGIQSETGGNLAEILEGLATVVRGRGTLGKRVKSLSSEGKASALLLSGLPIFLIGSIFLSQPTFYTSKFDDPIFWPTAGVVCLVYLLGWFMIHRIINFKY